MYHRCVDHPGHKDLDREPEHDESWADWDGYEADGVYDEPCEENLDGESWDEEEWEPNIRIPDPDREDPTWWMRDHDEPAKSSLHALFQSVEICGHRS